MDGVELGGALPSRKSLVPRKTFMTNLRSMASALPQVREHGDAEKSLMGRLSHAQGASTAARPGDSRTEGTKGEQLLEVSAGQIILLTHAQHHPVFHSKHPSYVIVQMIHWLNSESRAAMLGPTALQVQASSIVQRLRMHTSMQPASAVPQAMDAGVQWQSSILPRNSSAGARQPGHSRTDGPPIPRQPRPAASRWPCWPALRAAWQGQHGGKPPAQR